MSRERTNHLIIAGLIAVLAGAIAGMAYLWQVKTQPGAVARTPATWPAASDVATRPGVPTLVMFAHPRCPCTRASLAELRTLMSGRADRVDAHVLQFVPAGARGDWLATDTWRAAADIPGVQVSADPDRREARRFGAETSGHVVVYDAAGRLQFSGGITSARGHVGNSEAARRVAAILDAAPTPPGRAPVFGCSLADPPHATAMVDR